MRLHRRFVAALIVVGLAPGACTRTSAPEPAGADPYAAVLYDPSGETWVYTSPGRLAFVRAPIRIDRIVGDRAFLSSGPPAGTDVVTVGAPELLGVEYEVGEE